MNIPANARILLQTSGRRADPNAGPGRDLGGCRGLQARTNSARGIGRAPRLARCALSTWQSIRPTSRARNSSTSRMSATFDASRSRLNIDSPKKTRPSATP